MSAINIQFNMERLGNVVKSNLVQFYGEPLTPDLIEKLTARIAETVNEFINYTDSQTEKEQQTNDG